MKLNNILDAIIHLTKRPLTYHDLIRNEAKIGGKLFGSIPENHRREFFCLDERTWVWHEEWYDKIGKSHSTTTRYEVHADRILKVQNGEYYQIDKDEAINFYQATLLYLQKIRSELYDQTA